MAHYENGRTFRERLFSGLLVYPVTGCLLWTRTTTDGYGYISVKGKMLRVHVVMWEMFEGPVPEGCELDHCACPYRRCASIAHLEPVTHRENMLRSERARSPVCLRCGTPYSGDNLYIKIEGDGRQHRGCQACETRRRQEHKARGYTRTPQRVTYTRYVGPI